MNCTCLDQQLFINTDNNRNTGSMSEARQGECGNQKLENKLVA